MTGVAARLEGARGYEVVLLLVVLNLVGGAIAPFGSGALLSSVLAVVLWLAVASVVGLTRRACMLGLAAASGVVALAAVAYAIDSHVLRGIGDLLVGAAVAVLAVIISRSLLRGEIVTAATVVGALCIYLLIGLFFAQAYLGVLDFQDDAFASSFGHLGRFDLIYFSFIALTTVGFGDIVPAVDLTRALAMIEAVTGQLFLVTVVAAVVGRVGLERRYRK